MFFQRPLLIQINGLTSQAVLDRRPFLEEIEDLAIGGSQGGDRSGRKDHQGTQEKNDPQYFSCSWPVILLSDDSFRHEGLHKQGHNTVRIKILLSWGLAGSQSGDLLPVIKLCVAP